MRRLTAGLAALALALTACAPPASGSAAPASAAAPAATPVPTAMPKATATPEPAPTPAPDGVDVDLTTLSATMVFAEVASMIRTPEHYLGKTIRMRGPLMVYEANPALEIDWFYTVVVQDATACCQQGMEFVWEDGTLPEAGTMVQVTGSYEAYDCGGMTGYHIVAQTVEVLG